MKPPCPLFVELCAGTAALSIRLADGDARPPLSRLGSKQGYANIILERMGLAPGQGAERFLWCDPDEGVQLLLLAYTSRQIALDTAAQLRAWSDEPPKDLWERLKAEGPLKGAGPSEIARWTWLMGHAYRKGIISSGYEGDGAHPLPTETMARRLLDVPELEAVICPDATKVEPRELARWLRIFTANELINVDSENWKNTGAGGSTFGGEFCRPIEKLIERVEGLPEVSAVVASAAFDPTPAKLPEGSWAYIDPPYVDTTGYGNDLPREEVVRLARAWREAGADVCISEQEPIPELVEEGWHVVNITSDRIGQKRSFSKQQLEYLTMTREPRGQLGFWGIG